jgi:hypothetical protein
MDPFMYVAHPENTLRMHNSAHLEHVKKSEWRNARHIEELRRSQQTPSPTVDPAAHPAEQEPATVRPRATRRAPWSSWRGVLHLLHLPGWAR